MTPSSATTSPSMSRASRRPGRRGYHDTGPAGSSFQFATGAASKALTVELLAGASDESVHTATINTESFQGGSDRLTFAAGQSLVYGTPAPRPTTP